MFKLILMGTFAALMAVAAASAQSPYPTPKPDGTARIQRSGTCPTGYVGVGRFCEALHRDTRIAYPKFKGAPCPAGTFSSGDYCKSYR